MSILQNLPTASTRRHALRITPAGERALRHGSPWLYDTWLEGECPGAPGDLAVAFDHRKKFLAIGLWDPTSVIRLRVLHQGSPVVIDSEWFRQRILAAQELRKPVTDSGSGITDGYRMLNGENDGLPGLVVDRFDRTCVIKIYTLAWIPYLNVILDILHEMQDWERVVLRLNRAMQSRPDLLHGLRDGQILSGAPLNGPVLFRENGVVFEAEPVIGQKTGFFLDQRDNRARVERLSRGLSVLNVFSYTGGFSVYAARGGASQVTSLDISAPAMQAAQRNFSHNRIHPTVAACSHEPLAEDAFVAMERMRKNGRKFGLVILDPPMFAQSKAQVESALAAYARLTQLGLAVLEPGGVLVQASCSNRVTSEQFFETVFATAQAAGRPLREIERTGHAQDHPCTFEGGAYLKCLFARG
jgi:23S rRNA (cytosine1962-C5)-methyltransferase